MIDPNNDGPMGLHGMNIVMVIPIIGISVMVIPRIRISVMVSPQKRISVMVGPLIRV